MKEQKLFDPFLLLYWVLLSFDGNFDIQPERSLKCDAIHAENSIYKYI